MNEIHTFVVAAWPAAGKSVATAEIYIALNRAGFHVNSFSDKEALLRQVEFEVASAGKSLQTDASIEVDNFTLLNPSEDRRSWGIQFKNSATLNEAHSKMIDEIARSTPSTDGNIKNVIEIAYGENAQYPDGPLKQTAKDFLDQFAERGILDESAWIDVYARQIFRSPRNEKRRNEVGYIPQDEFKKYFGDIGGFTPDDVDRLGSRYKRITNEFKPKWYYQKEIWHTVDNFILPFIKEEGSHIVPESHLPARYRR